MYKSIYCALFAGATLLAHAQTSPPADGLVLWLNADQGVDRDGTNVIGWADQSPNANNAGPLSGDYGGDGTQVPFYIENSVNGHAAVRFDGTNSVLEIPNSGSLQPADGSWSVFIVARRLGPGGGDFPQIIGARPWLAGLDKGWAVTLDETGLLASHFADDAAGHDAPQTRSATPLADTFEVWQVEENRDSSMTTFYRRGDVDKTSSTAMPLAFIDQFDPTFIGREMGGANNRRANIDLAEVLVYNRALTKEDRLAATKYLATRYGLPFTLNIPPSIVLTSPAQAVTNALPATVVVTANATDQDGSIARVEFYDGTTLLASATQPPFSFTLKPLAPGTLNLSATAIDDRGERVSSAAVPVTITGTAPALSATNGLQIWLRADSALIDTDGVLQWNDGSGNENNATQFDPSLQPEIAADIANGQAVLRFDGEDDYLEIPNSLSLQPGTNDWTTLFVARRLTASQGDFPQVIGSRPWTAGLDKGWAVAFDSSGVVSSHFADGAAGHDVPATLASSSLDLNNFQLWQVEENRAASQTAFYLNGGLNRATSTPMPTGAVDQAENIEIGREIGGSDSRRANMELAEVLIFNRVLGAADRESVTAYLAGRYGIAASKVENAAPTVALTAPVSGAVVDAGTEVTIAATASDVDGSVAQVQFFSGSRLLGTVTNAPYTIKVSNLSVGPQTLVARALDNLGQIASSASIQITNRLVDVTQPLTLIGTTDYSDTFTVGESGDPSEENPRPNGMYNNDSFGGYNVEDSHGNAPANWLPTENFSFNTPGNSTGPAITQAATGNDGAATGFAQSGSKDFSFAYGIRSNYVVQVDAILPLDRLDIGSYAIAGDPISAPNSLTVFFRKDSSTGQAAGIALYNGTKETAVTNGLGQGIITGIDDQNWHEFGVHFNMEAHTLGIYIDGFLKAKVDLSTFGGGAYANYSNAAVGTGGAGFNGTQAQWMDNFKVGQPGPDLDSGTPAPSIAIQRSGAEIQLNWAGAGEL